MHRVLFLGLVALVVLAILIYGAVRAYARQQRMTQALEDQAAQLRAMVQMLERIAIAQEGKAK